MTNLTNTELLFLLLILTIFIILPCLFFIIGVILCPL